MSEGRPEETLKSIGTIAQQDDSLAFELQKYWLYGLATVMSQYENPIPLW